MKQPALGENGFEFLGFKLRNGNQQWTQFDCSFTQGCDTLEATNNWDPWNVRNEAPARNVQWSTPSLWSNDSNLPGRQTSASFQTSAAMTLPSYTSERVLPNLSAQTQGTDDWLMSSPKPQTNPRNPFVQSWTSNQPIEAIWPTGQSTVNWCDAMVSRGASEQV
ncbi:hypothetical protein P879_03851 [Paragonimus westermani]|uniref:Uncharacterized protein n=1 Tax=Paragonimus westermani TaxID=34504 RepID=A0A8T0DN68_9TREM|nr:hypothetical protein P879_03851 [Paragonimus westermani]